MLPESPFPLLESQLSPPRLPAKVLPRPALLDRLRQGAEKPLCLVCAWPGAGKTTLLSQWRKQLLIEGKTVAWLSPTVAENEPWRFFAALAAALHGADPALGERLRLLLAAGESAPMEMLAALVCNEIASPGESRLTLILDDLQHLHNPDIHRGLGFILEHAPENLHLILSGRRRPALPLAWLHAYDRATELDSQDLSLDLQETRDLIQLHASEGFAEECLQDLYQRTEGWLTGVMLAIRWAKQGKRKAQRPERFDGRAGPVQDYFRVMVRQQHDPELMGFLNDISVLETFDAALCDHLRQRQDAGHWIALLGEHNLFLQAAAEPANGYRLQPLFADYLSACLQSDSTERFTALHRRAMQWHAERREWHPAVEHALASADTENAIRFVEKCAMSLVRHSDLLTLLKWLNELEDASSRQTHTLKLAELWVRALLMQREEARHLLAELKTRTPEPNASSLSVSLQAVEVILATHDDDWDAALRLGASLLRSVDLLPPLVAGTICNTLTYTYIREGDLAKAAECQQLFTNLELSIDNPFAHLYHLVFHGLIHETQGDLRYAYEYYRTAFTNAETQNGTHSIGCSLSAAMLALVHYERNELETVMELLQHRIQALYRYGQLEPVLRAHLTFTRVLRLRGEARRSEALDRHVEDLAEKRRWPRLLAACLTEGIRVRLAHNDIAAAEALLESLGGFAEPHKNTPRSLRLTTGHDYQLSRGRILLAQHRPDTAAQVLSGEAHRLESVKFHYAATVVYALLARCHWAQDNEEAAFAWLTKALLAGSRGGLCRTFVDEGETLLEMLRALVTRGETTADSSLDMPYITALIAAFEAEIGPNQEPAPQAVPPSDAQSLSRKEKEILMLVANGLSNKEIANALSITLGTTKWHLRNVYDKLGVSSRTEAVCEAKALELIQ